MGQQQPRRTHNRGHGPSSELVTVGPPTIPSCDDCRISDDRERALPADAGGQLPAALEHRVRLAVCVLLTRYDRLSFSRLKELTGETDGNLGANLSKLEEAGFLAVYKEFLDRKPISWYAITAQAEKSLKARLDALSRLIAQAGKKARPLRSARS